jgi:polyisoprenoid-binding protein YceI
MRLTISHAAVALFALVPRHTPTELVAQPESQLWVEGTSTIRSFKCTVPEFDLKVDGDANAVTAVLDAKKAVKTVTLSLAAPKIDCGSGTMNDHMRESLKADKLPTIRFTLSGYDVAKAAAGVEGTVHGSLLLGGTEKPVDVTAVATDAGNGALHIVGSYELALSAFDLKAPSLMFGRIKVGDKVQVKFDLVLKS